MKTKYILIAAITLCILVIGRWAVDGFTEPRTITVGGDCLASAPKDRTAITLRVQALDKSAAKSMQIASTKAAEINEYLKTLDVKVQTSEFNSYEKTEWNHVTQKSEELGTETVIALDVSAKNIDVIEKVLTQFAGQPDIYVTNLRMFTATETLQPIIESCLGTAVENARIRADALASGDGKRAGKLLAVSYGTNGAYDVRPVANFRMAKAEMVGAAADSGYAGGALAGKDTEVSVHVSAIFEIR